MLTKLNQFLHHDGSVGTIYGDTTSLLEYLIREQVVDETTQLIDLKIADQSTTWEGQRPPRYRVGLGTNCIGYLSEPVPQFYPALLDLYAELLRNNPAIEGVDFNTPHLLWMLGLIKYSEDMSLTKKHRWLGFVQGVMIANGLTTVADQRDHTRAMFDGA